MMLKEVMNLTIELEQIKQGRSKENFSQEGAASANIRLTKQKSGNTGSRTHCSITVTIRVMIVRQEMTYKEQVWNSENHMQN